MKRAANQPTTEIAIYGGIYVKTHTVADAGTLLPQHAHVYSHISMIVSGSVQVWCGDEDMGDYHAPAMVKIAAHKLHKFQTLTPGVVIACIHSVGEADAVLVAQEHVVEMED
jgi:mannose-6-phosphate isomerase-like protein (cupin superfamily)